MPPRPLLALFLCGLLAGCGTPTRKLSLYDAGKLPVSSGTYLGKIWTVPWLYLGSDARFHYFRYTYTRGNQVRFIRVLIAKAELTLAFERSVAALQGRMLEVTPVMGPFGGIETFTLGPQRTLPRWDAAPPPLPRFDEKVVAPPIVP